MTLHDKAAIMRGKIPKLYEKGEYFKCRGKCNDLIALVGEISDSEDAGEMNAIAYEYLTQISKKGLCGMTFKELLQGATVTDAHLVHSDIDIETSTMACDWNIASFTPKGIERYANLMNAVVLRIFHGIFGLQIELTGVSHRDIEQFNFDQAGNCSDSDYKKWFTDED